MAEVECGSRFLWFCLYFCVLRFLVLIVSFTHSKFLCDYLRPNYPFGLRHGIEMVDVEDDAMFVTSTILFFPLSLRAGSCGSTF